MLKQRLLPQFPEFKSLKWRYCGQADEEHRKKASSYAHVLDKSKYICVSHKIKDLGEEQIAGIIAHEIGHLIIAATAEKQCERRADAHFYFFTDIKISYDKNKLQYIDDWKKVKKELQKKTKLVEDEA